MPRPTCRRSLSNRSLTHALALSLSLVLALLRCVLVRACLCVPGVRKGYVCLRVCGGLVVVVTFTLMEYVSCFHVDTSQNSVHVLRGKNGHAKVTWERSLQSFSRSDSIVRRFSLWRFSGFPRDARIRSCATRCVSWESLNSATLSVVTQNGCQASKTFSVADVQFQHP